MPAPRHDRGRRRLAGRSPITSIGHPTTGDEDGYVLVIVMVLSVVILALSALVIQASTVDQAVTTAYTSTVQSRLAAETDLNVAVSQIGTVLTTTPASNDANGNMLTSTGSILRSLLPCTATSTTAPGFTASVVYDNISGTPITGCPATWSSTSATWPAQAVVTSLGTYLKSPTKLVENLTVTAPTLTVTAPTSVTGPSTTTLLPAFGAAIYSQGAVSLSGNVSATTTSSSTPANIISGAGVTCPNNVTVQGSIYSYSTTAAGTFANSCVISGSLYANTGIALSNGVSIGGDVWSFASSGISLSNTVRVGGNAWATAGPITTYSGTTIVGNASAYGAISYNKGGATPSAGAINGTVTQNDSALSSQAFPTQPPFPALSDPTQAAWQASEYANYVSVTSSGESINGGALNTAMTCSTYFSSQYLAANNYQASPSQFALDISAATTPTVIDAPTCTPNLSGPNAIATYSLKVDVAVVLASLQTSGTNTFASSTTTAHNLSIIVPAPQTGSITLSNATTFAGTLNTLMYTEGTFSAANSSVMQGQILSATSMAGSNGFALTYSASSSSTIPGASTVTPGQTVVTPGSSVVTVGSLAPLRRYVSR
jgi:hypothetical protein